MNSALPTGSELRTAPKKVEPGSGLFCLQIHKRGRKKNVNAICLRHAAMEKVNKPAVGHVLDLEGLPGEERPVLGAERVFQTTAELLNLDPKINNKLMPYNKFNYCTTMSSVQCTCTGNRSLVCSYSTQ